MKWRKLLARPRRRRTLVAVAVLSVYCLWRLLSALLDDGLVLVTGYCNCEQCCGWETGGDGEPVYVYGPMNGKRKEVGRTARGTVARRGTVAADLKVYPFGTMLEIPGDGEGVVEDVGGAIRGRHIDVWFPTHEEARQWGRRKLPVKRIKSP